MDYPRYTASFFLGTLAAVLCVLFVVGSLGICLAEM